jgi:hypothetical protein
MSPDAHKTARTAIVVVGGLMGLGLLAGIVGVFLVASEGEKMMNQPPQPLPTPPGGQINSQLGPS